MANHFPPPCSPTTLDLASLRAHLLDLLCTDAYQEGDFQLSSGQRSTYYLNSKPVTLHPWGAVAVARLLLPLIGSTAAGVAGLTLGADPLVSAVSVVGTYEGRSLAALIVRKEPKGHGTQAYIEGPSLPPGSSLVVLEDVVTTGKSALQAVERLRAAGYQVTAILALVDRDQGGPQLYHQSGLGFQALFQILEIQSRWQELKKL